VPALERDESDEVAARPEAPIDGPSLWGEDGGAVDAASAGTVGDAGALFRQARAALDDGHPADAAAALILALRASPSIAPAVRDLLAGRSEPILAVVRGDAARIVGHDLDAMRDHAAAAASLDDRGATPDLDDPDDDDPQSDDHEPAG
jgi:hypothetical protein